MKALIVDESSWGNTRAVAETSCATLSELYRQLETTESLH